MKPLCRHQVYLWWQCGPLPTNQLYDAFWATFALAGLMLLTLRHISTVCGPSSIVTVDIVFLPCIHVQGVKQSVPSVRLSAQKSPDYGDLGIRMTDKCNWTVGNLSLCFSMFDKGHEYYKSCNFISHTYWPHLLSPLQHWLCMLELNIHKGCQIISLVYL